MVSVPPDQQSVPVPVVDADHLADWSAEDFDLVARLARAPRVLIGGLGGQQVTLTCADPRRQPVEMAISLALPEGTLTALASAAALDGLVGLLEGSGTAQVGVGRTVSPDAVEAILAGLLAPLGLAGIGPAVAPKDHAKIGDHHPVVALEVNGTQLPLAGPTAALGALETHFATHSAPLEPVPERFAVALECVVGWVDLSDEELLRLEPGGGVVLDAVWPDGLTVVGRRFVAHGDAWRTETALANGALRLRAGRALRRLDDADLKEALEPHTVVELVGGETTLATGHLATVSNGNHGPRIIFALDPAGSL